MTGVTVHLSLITLNVNGLNSGIKRQGLVVGLKTRPNHLLFIGNLHFTDKDIHRGKVKKMKANGN
jgi:hypothetical protein